MKKIGIIGAGNMGSGLAQKMAQEGLSVVMVDVEPELVERGFENVRETLGEAVEREILRPQQVDEILGRIEGTTELEDTRDCDLIIEAVFEEMEVKRDLFARLEKVSSPKTIFASNTSSFSVAELARATGRADRFVGLHFFYHPAKNRLLEIMPGAATSRETLVACKRFSELIGKTDILVKDSPGFAVNRFFVPWLNEATRMLEEGLADIPTIEEAGMRSLGIGMGPFELMNVTGVPIAYHAAVTLGNKLGPFYQPAEIFKAQFESGELFPLKGDVDEEKLGAVVDRFWPVIFYVTAKLLEEGVAKMEDIDVGAKVGLRWRKGPFELMNQLGIDKALALVEDFLRNWPDLEVPENLRGQGGRGSHGTFAT